MKSVAYDVYKTGYKINSQCLIAFSSLKNEEVDICMQKKISKVVPLKDNKWGKLFMADFYFFPLSLCILRICVCVCVYFCFLAMSMYCFYKIFYFHLSRNLYTIKYSYTTSQSFSLSNLNISWCTFNIM